MTFVVDANVAIKWFVPETLHEQALLLLDQPEDLHAPAFLVLEISSIVWKKALRGEITDVQAQLIIAAIHRYISFFHATADLSRSALSIALEAKHPVYDCMYLACADAISGTLITADRKLYAVAQGTRFQNLVSML